MVTMNFNRPIVKITLLLTSALVVLGGAILAPALPAIGEAFQEVSNAGILVRLVLTLPALFIALSAPFAGYVVDSIGRKKVLLAAVLGTGLAGFSGWLAATLPFLLVGRALLGIAVAGVMISTTTLIADYYFDKTRARMMGYQAGFMGIGGTVLLIVVGVLADLDWKTPFLIYLIPFLVLPLGILVLREPQFEARCAENPPPVGEPGSCVGEALKTPAAAAAPESRKAPIRLIALIYGLILFVEIVFYLVPIQLPFYLKELTGATAAQSGLAIAVMSLAFAVASILYGRIASYFDHISVVLLAFVLIGTGYSLVALLTETWLLYIGLIAAGAGIGFMVPNLYVWLANETPLAIRARVLGSFTTALFLGQFLSPLISQPLTLTFDAGFTFLLAAGLLFVLAPLGYLARGRLRSLDEKAAQPGI